MFFGVYLWNDREPAPEVMQSYCGDIDIIDEDASFSCFNNSKQAVCQA